MRDDNYIFIVYNKSSIQKQEYRMPVGMWNGYGMYIPTSFYKNISMQVCISNMIHSGTFISSSSRIISINMDFHHPDSEMIIYLISIFISSHPNSSNVTESWCVKTKNLYKRNIKSKRIYIHIFKKIYVWTSSIRPSLHRRTIAYIQGVYAYMRILYVVD